tara:strand:+ start:5439 stop:6131 length:693 start_codon:yes stop_codon:yes gene_type:complete
MNNNAYDISQLHAEWAATDNGDPMAEADLAETINRMEQPRGTKRGADKICQPINFCKGYMQNNTCCTFDAKDGLCKMHKKKHYQECNICFDNMYVKQRLVCGHEFCRNCIYKWAGEEKGCPICRTSMVFTNYSKAAYIQKVKDLVYCIDQYVQDIKWTDASRWLNAIEDEIYDCVTLMVTNEWMMHCTEDYKRVLSTYIGYGNQINEKRFRKLTKIWNRIEPKKVFKNES